MNKKRVSAIPLWLILLDVITVGLWVFRGSVFKYIFSYSVQGIVNGKDINTELIGKLYGLIPIAAIISIVITVIIILANLGKKKQAAFIKEAISAPTVTTQSVPTVVSVPANTTVQVPSNPNEGHMNLF